jgi:hypothetical protein
MKFDFVKGHMGGNTIALLCGDQIPAGRELEVAVKALGPHYLWAHEAGILYPGANGAGLKVKIAEPTSNCFISACGGLTQVLGKALVETGLGPRFNIDVREPATTVMLETEAGLAEIEIAVSAGKAVRIVTGMRSFVRECYGKGVREMELLGVRLMQVGKFMVLNADLLKRVHPGADFVHWDGETRHILTEMQQQFIAITGEPEYNIALYDWHPAGGGDLRVVYPHCMAQNYIEPSCGTGSVAVGLGVLACGELERRGFASGGPVNLKIEAGGSIELGGPDITALLLDIRESKVESASFSHSFVEITATGQIWFEQ